jgi:hypothetical protein
MPAAMIPVATARVMPTVIRRGAQSTRGRPTSVSVIGAPISTPSVSPAHQVSPLMPSVDGGTAPLQPSASVATPALTMQATGAPSKRNSAMSRGSASVSGCRTKRLTSDAPAQACSAAPTAISIGMPMFVQST